MPLVPIYYDTETTGLDPERDRVIEIAAYNPDNNTTFQRFINPGVPIPAEAVAISGITDSMVAEAGSFMDVFPEFVTFCGPEAVLVAHNNDRFDQPFLEHECARCGVPLPSWKYIDTLLWARKYRPDLPGHALQRLREVYGVPPNQAHRALDDTMTLHHVFSLMKDDLSMDEVWDLLRGSRAVMRMPFGKYQGRLLSEVPSSYVQWLHGSGALDKPGSKDLKEALMKLGVLSV